MKDWQSITKYFESFCIEMGNIIQNDAQISKLKQGSGCGTVGVKK